MEGFVNLQIKIGMPEVLVLFSTLMYSQDKFVAIAALSIGILGRAISTVMDYGNQANEKSLAKKEPELIVS